MVHMLGRVWTPSWCPSSWHFPTKTLFPGKTWGTENWLEAGQWVPVRVCLWVCLRKAHHREHIRNCQRCRRGCPPSRQPCPGFLHGIGSRLWLLTSVKDSDTYLIPVIHQRIQWRLAVSSDLLISCFSSKTARSSDVPEILKWTIRYRCPPSAVRRDSNYF